MDGQETLTVASCVQAYLRVRKLDGYSDKTLYSYKLHLKRLAVDLDGSTPIDIIRLEHLRTHLMNLAHLQTSSLANKVRALKAFFKWLYEEEILERNPALKLREPRLPARIPKALSVEEVELLRDACGSLLEHALIEFFFATGCRVSEIHQLDRIDLDWPRRSVVVLGKGNKEREVYFGAKAALWLKRYLDNRSDSSLALFVTKRRRRQPCGALEHQRLSTSQIQRIFKRVAERCGLEEKVTPHVLRHTLATLLLNQGAPIAAVQSILGHASPTTTQLYVNLSGESRQMLYKRHFAQ